MRRMVVTCFNVVKVISIAWPIPRRAKINRTSLCGKQVIQYLQLCTIRLFSILGLNLLYSRAKFAI